VVGFLKGWLGMKTKRHGRRLSDAALRRRVVFLTAALSIAVVVLGSCGQEVLQTADAGGRGLTKGPVLLRVGRDRAAVMWETNREGSCKLHYGRDRAASKHVESRPQKASRGAYVHKVWLERLESGRIYQYRVEGPGVKSAAYQFKTVPAKTDRVKFIVYGDSRTNFDKHRRLIELMMKIKDLDFIVHVGDLVTSGNKYEQWGPQYFDVVKGLAERIPIYIAKGNHEGDNGNFERLLIPPGRDNSFRIDFGPLHYFGIDNSPKKQKPGETRAMLEAVLRDARSNDAAWKFVTYHKPSLNFGHHWSAWAHPDALPRQSQVGIDFVLTGHSHQYERFKPVAPPKGTKGSYVTYITTGGGGAPLHDVKPKKFHALAKKTYEFCLFEIVGDELSMYVINIDGEVLDRLRLRKMDGRLNRDYIDTALSMADVVQYQKKNLGKEY